MVFVFLLGAQNAFASLIASGAQGYVLKAKVRIGDKTSFVAVKINIEQSSNATQTLERESLLLQQLQFESKAGDGSEFIKQYVKNFVEPLLKIMLHRILNYKKSI